MRGFGLEPDIPRGANPKVLSFLSAHYKLPIRDILARKQLMRWLVLDCDYLCHRAYHTTGELSYKGMPTGVIFGFFRELISSMEFFDSQNLIFCWDSKTSFRKGVYPSYKSNRSEKDGTLTSQIRDLRRIHLPRIGFRNIFRQKGYEADDLIATLCYTALKEKRTVIVSADKDLYQLLDQNVAMWSPRKQEITTAAAFSREYGVSPIQWIDVRAIAGCSTDCIQGVAGVGEKTAAKFLNGTLNMSSAKGQAIIRGNKIWKRNMLLVKLPYPGVEPMYLTKDEFNIKEWMKICRELGMGSIETELEMMGR